MPSHAPSSGLQVSPTRQYVSEYMHACMYVCRLCLFVYDRIGTPRRRVRVPVRRCPYMCVCLCVYIYVCVCVCVSVYIICTSVCLPVYLCVCLFVYLSLYICMCLCLSVCLSVCVSVCTSTEVFVHSPVSPSPLSFVNQTIFFSRCMVV